MLNIKPYNEKFKFNTKKIVLCILLIFVGYILIYYYDTYNRLEIEEYLKDDDDYSNPSIIPYLLFLILVPICTLILVKTKFYIRYWKHFIRDISLTIIISYLITAMMLNILNLKDWFILYLLNFSLITIILYVRKQFRRLLNIRESKNKINIEDENLNKELNSLENYKVSNDKFYINSIGFQPFIFISKNDFTKDYEIDYLNYELSWLYKKYPNSIQKYKYIIFIERISESDVNRINYFKFKNIFSIYDTENKLLCDKVIFENNYPIKSGNEEEAKTLLDLEIFDYFFNHDRIAITSQNNKID